MYRTEGLPKAWVSFVSQWPWSWFCHFTYRDNPYTDEMIHPESAVKIYDKFIHILNREIFGVRYWNRPNDGVIWIRARENQYRGAIHFHALIGRVPEWISRLKYMDLHDKMGGYAGIHPYKGKGCGAEEYLCKFSICNEPPRSKLRGISRLVAALQTKQASGNMTRRDLKRAI